jgi:translation initiation factor IF-2
MKGFSCNSNMMLCCKKRRRLKVWVEEVLKDKTEAEERVRKSLKEKDEVETIAQKTQEVVQKLYKAIPEVPIVVEATMEEQVLNMVKSLRDSERRFRTYNCGAYQERHQKCEKEEKEW